METAFITLLALMLLWLKTLTNSGNTCKKIQQKKFAEIAVKGFDRTCLTRTHITFPSFSPLPAVPVNSLVKHIT